MGMIDAKQAKEILGCDDATLQSHINSGALRTQKQGGKLMVDADDVAKLSKKEDEEGTIVLTGESDNLQIDLGKVVDESSETIVQPKAQGNKDSQQITFGEELEVVSLEDSKTQELDQTRPTTAQGLSFTDSNTAVMTSVDETNPGGTTAAVETGPTGGPIPSGESGRRSVRSSRRAPEQEEQVRWYWFAPILLSFVLGAFFVVPYYFVANVSRPDERDAGRGVLRGADDTIWSSMAGGVAGFTVEPDQTVWNKLNPGGQYKDIRGEDDSAVWRRDVYMGALKNPGERLKSFKIATINGDVGKSVVGDKTYKIIEKPGDPKPLQVEPAQ